MYINFLLFIYQVILYNKKQINISIECLNMNYVTITLSYQWIIVCKIYPKIEYNILKRAINVLILQWYVYLETLFIVKKYFNL